MAQERSELRQADQDGMPRSASNPTLSNRDEYGTSSGGYAMAPRDRRESSFTTRVVRSRLITRISSRLPGFGRHRHSSRNDVAALQGYSDDDITPAPSLSRSLSEHAHLNNERSRRHRAVSFCRKILASNSSETLLLPLPPPPLLQAPLPPRAASPTLMDPSTSQASSSWSYASDDGFGSRFTGAAAAAPAAVAPAAARGGGIVKTADRSGDLGGSERGAGTAAATVPAAPAAVPAAAAAWPPPSPPVSMEDRRKSSPLTESRKRLAGVVALAAAKARCEGGSEGNSGSQAQTNTAAAQPLSLSKPKPPIRAATAPGASSGVSAVPAPPHFREAVEDLFQQPEGIVKYGDVVRLWSRSKYLEEGTRSPPNDSDGGDAMHRNRSQRHLFKRSNSTTRSDLSSNGGSSSNRSVGGPNNNSISLLAQSSSSSFHSVNGSGNGGGSASTDGGYVGLYRKVSRRRSLLGRGDLVVVGPLGDAEGEFVESSLQVVDPHAVKQDGQAVRYGDVVILCDTRAANSSQPLVWNVDTHGYTGYVDMKPRHRKGELFVTFRRAEAAENRAPNSWGPPEAAAKGAAGAAAFGGAAVAAAEKKDADLGMPLRYGEHGVRLVVSNAHMNREKRPNQVLTAFKKESSRLVGGYVCVDGHGYPLLFAVHRARPVVKGVQIRTWAAAPAAAGSRLAGGGGGGRGLTPTEQVHHNLPWDNVVTFRMPEGQIAAADLPELAREPVVLLTLTNGCRATLFTRDILNLPDRELWVMTTGGTERGRLQLRCVTEVKYRQNAPGDEFNEKNPAHVALSRRSAPSRRSLAVLAAAGALAAPFASRFSFLLFRWWFYAGVLPACFAFWTIGQRRRQVTARRRRGSSVTALAAASAAKPPIEALEVSIVPLQWEQLPDLPEGEGEDADDATLRGLDGNNARASDFIVDPTTGLPPMPRRFLLAELGDYQKAQVRWQQTLQWREMNRVDSILEEPHELFDVINHYYFHCVHLPDRAGNLCYYERPGLLKWEALRAQGVEKEVLVRHYIFVMEFLWKRLQPQETAKLTIVLDLDGVRLRDLAGEAVSFLKTTVGMMAAHYPQRSFKIFILNTPAFFSTMFGLVKPLLAEHTRQKINVLNPASAAKGLLEWIDTASLPPEYGGACSVPLRAATYVQQMREHVLRVLAERGRTMRPIPDA